jgi:hypothetical protein
MINEVILPALAKTDINRIKIGKDCFYLISGNS